MSAVVTPTRRPLWLKFLRRFMLAWYRFEISSAEEWIRECARSGIKGTNGLRELDRQVQAARCKLALWEAS